MRRRRDPRVVVLVVAGFAVLSGVVVGMAARWPIAGVVVAFVLVSTAAVVAADSPSFRTRLGTFRRRAADAVRDGLTADEFVGEEPRDVESAMAQLGRAGVVVDGGDGELPSVAPEFERAWRRRIVSMGDRSEDERVLAGLLSAPRREVGLEWDEEEGALVATVRGARAGRWPSRAAFVADVTAVAEFRRRYPGWWTVSPAMRTRTLATLRLCLDWCPTCDGAIRTDRVDGGADAESGFAATCEACAARLFEADCDPVRLDDSRLADADAEA